MQPSSRLHLSVLYQSTGMSDVDRFQILFGYCVGLTDPKHNKERFETVKSLIEQSDSVEVMFLVDALVNHFDDMETTKTVVTRLLNVVGHVLPTEVPIALTHISYIRRMIEENARIIAMLDRMKTNVTAVNKTPDAHNHWKEIQQGIRNLKPLTSHYVEKENLLFPIIERHIDRHGCLAVMWSIHDDVRHTIKQLENLMTVTPVNLMQFNTLIGRLFFDMRSMVLREERVLLPAMARLMDETMMQELSKDQFDESQVATASVRFENGRIDLATGSPTAAQLIQIFNHLPVDITLIDRNDKVVYFNTPQHRIFPRSAAVVGRSVQNCHPPKSVDIVNRILAAFRTKERTSAEFRLQMKGLYILISYIALYDEHGSYDGTLEITQDITRLKTLKGERRLLDW